MENTTDTPPVPIIILKISNQPKEIGVTSTAMFLTPA
jgi:hypothetical protein